MEQSKKKFKQISLFSGIGGFDIASEWAGWQTAAWCEWESYCQEILKYYWPEAKQFSNIKESNFEELRDTVHVLTGGFPCQPYSTAGKRLGKQDERHLWPEMCRVINEVRPNWVVGENVRGLLSWNKGIVFDEVCADLENFGYDVTVFLIPAVSVGAPHRRDRVWFVAKRSDYEGTDSIQDYDFSDSEVFPKTDWQCFPQHYPTSNSNEIDKDSLKISPSKWRNSSIKSYGNAIVPQVVFELFKVINKYEYERPDNKNWKGWFLNELMLSEGWIKKYPIKWSQKVLMNRSYNILTVNTKHVVEGEIVSGLLLKTPCAADAYSENLTKKEQKFGNSGTLAQEVATGFVYKRDLLPTPTTSDSMDFGVNVEQRKEKNKQVELKHLAKSFLLPTPRASKISGTDRADFSPSLPGLMNIGLLPTPTVNDMKNATLPQSQTNKINNIVKNILDSETQIEKTSKLNPEFVGEMMGFPAYWTIIPFLNEK